MGSFVYLQTRSTGDTDPPDCGASLPQAYLRLIGRIGGGAVGREPLLARATNIGVLTDGAVLKMGVWSPEVGLQGRASNHLMRLHLRCVVVNDEEKAVTGIWSTTEGLTGLDSGHLCR